MRKGRCVLSCGNAQLSCGCAFSPVQINMDCPSSHSLYFNWSRKRDTVKCSGSWFSCVGVLSRVVHAEVRRSLAFGMWLIFMKRQLVALSCAPPHMVRDEAIKRNPKFSPSPFTTLFCAPPLVCELITGLGKVESLVLIHSVMVNNGMLRA